MNQKGAGLAELYQLALVYFLPKLVVHEYIATFAISGNFTLNTFLKPHLCLCWLCRLEVSKAQSTLQAGVHLGTSSWQPSMQKGLI